MPAAALGFKHLCDACKGLLAPLLEALMQLYHRIQPGGDVVGEGAARPEGLAVDEDAVQQVRPQHASLVCCGESNFLLR